MTPTPPMKGYVARRWSLAVLMTLLVIVPVTVLGVVTVRTTSNSIRERVADRQLSIGRTLAEQVERDIDLVEVRTAEIARRAAFTVRGAEDPKGAMEELLDEVFGERPYLRRVAVYDATGAPLAAVPDGEVPVSPQGGASRISEATVRVSEQRALLVLVFPLEPAGRQLVAEIDMAEVVPVVEEARLGSGGRASLALADGTVLVTGDASKQGRVLPEVVGIVDVETEQTTVEPLRSPGSDEPELAAVTRLDNDWFIVVTEPRAVALAPVERQRRSIALAALATLIGGGGAALWFAHSLGRAQLALSASERRARQITEAAHNAFVAIDERGYITEWNSAATRLFGWTLAEVRGRRVADLVIPPHLREPHEAWLARLLEEGVSEDTVETTVVDREGRSFPVELSVSELHGVSGTEYFAFVRDITERKQLERERLEAARQLELANEELRMAGELKNDFLAMASHELRTPLTSISGFAKTMRTMWSQLGDEDKQRYVGIIDEQADRLGRLVTDLLLLSRIEQGGLRVEPVAVDVSEAIERALRDMAIPVDVRVRCDERLVVMADEDHLQQVLINLVSNAVKYGRPPIQVEVRREPGEGEDGDGDGRPMASIAVEDHGTGVPKSFVDRLFERFSQAPEHQSDLRAGAGLGLSIVAGLVEAHGGDVRYETGSGGGARFVVRLPLSR